MATVKLATLAIRVSTFSLNHIPSFEELRSCWGDSSEAHQFTDKESGSTVSSSSNIFVSRLYLTINYSRHERFRGLCVSLAQRMHRGEILLRTNILGEPARHNVRPLSEARCAVISFVNCKTI